MQLPVTNRPRRDPLKEVVDIDCLRLGHQLHEATATPWADGEVPERPLGVVPFEVPRQIATFAVPAALCAIAGVVAGGVGLLYATPVALLVGAALDRSLNSAIEKAKWVADRADNGRYGLHRILCVRLNLRPEELTASRVAKLSRDFVQVRAPILAEWDARRAVARTLAPDYAAIGARNLAASAAVGAAAAGDSGDTHEHATLDWGSAFPDPTYDDMTQVHPYGDVNPATGMPMIDNQPLDVGGHVFGTDGY